MRRLAVIAAALLILGANVSAAQAPDKQPAAPAKAAKPAEQPTSRTQIIEEMVAAGRAAAENGVQRPFQTTMGTGGRGLIVAYLIAAHTDRAGYTALLKALEARAQKQVGATPTSKGATSLAMKGLAPKILGLALETGAVTGDVDGTSLTFRATPAGVIKALQNQGLVDMHADYSRSTFQRYASRLSVAATFDASKGPSAGTFTADRHQLTNWSVRAEIINGRDPSGYPELWRGLLRSDDPYRKAVVAIDAQLSAWTEYLTWENQLLAATERVVEKPLGTDKNIAAAAGRFRSLLESAMPRLEKVPNMSAQALTAMDGYVAQLTTLQSAIDDVYAFAAKGSLLTFDWSTARDDALPDLYTGTVGVGTRVWRRAQDRLDRQRGVQLLPPQARWRHRAVQELRHRHRARPPDR